ncbi:MAG: hypothetical protein OEV87_10840, partial [Phycisphaerae bacterium]|nr:hypothetical protein [Phycisphaerae bacterium]
MERTDTSIAPLSWKTYAMLTWLAGITVLSTWLLVRLTGLRREHSAFASCHPGPRAGIQGETVWMPDQVRHDNAGGLPERFYAQLESVAAKLGLKRLPQVVLTNKVACPAVFGVFRPVLLMPAEKFKTMTRKDTEHILLHELAHIKRGDLVVHAVWMLVQIVYWFNPLLWMIRRTLQNLRELCCDATVARLLRENTVHYRQTLLETARQLLAEPVDPGLGLLGLFENNNWLVTRLQWLEKNTWKNRPLRIATIIALVAVMATCVLPMASRQKTAADAEAMAAKEISGQKAEKDFCLLLLDDCDPDFKGKDTYEDKLYLLDNEFKIKGSLSGLNICQNVGGNHALAVDEKRKTAWVAESVGDRLFHINLKTGMIIQVLGNIKASSVSIDPKTGNAWVLTSEGTIYGKELVVFNPKGKSIASYDIHGQDIVYSRKDDCFWVVGKTVLKVNKKGDVLGKIEGQIPWCAVSVDIDENNGNAWIVVRAHSQVEGSRDEIWIVNSNVEVVKKISVDEMIPFCVSVDSNNKVAWIGCIATTMRFTTEGEKLTSARQCAGISIIHGFTKDDVFVASNHADYIEHAKILNDGTTESRIADNFGKSQKRIAFVPFSDAKLKGYKETQLPEEESTNSELKTTNYKATLPNGVTVELLGVCEVPENTATEDKQYTNWWKPDGSPLEKRPFKRSTFSSRKMYDDRKWYCFAFSSYGKNKYGGTLRRISVKESSGGGSGMMIDEYDEYLYSKALGHELSLLPSALDTTEIEFGFQGGPWNMLAKATDKPTEVTFEGKYLKITPAQIENGKLFIHTYEAFRHDVKDKHIGFGLIIEEDGKEIIKPLDAFPSDVTDDDEKDIRQEVYEINLPWRGIITSENIKGTCIRYFPFEYVTFKNVALRPGGKVQSSVISEQLPEKKAVKKESTNSELRTENYTATLPDGDIVEHILERADKEARQLNHEYIGTEHLLLALVSSDNAASAILNDLGVDAETVRQEIGKLIKAGSEPVTKKKLSLNKRAKEALANAKIWANLHKQDTVTSVDLLLGLAQSRESVASGVLNVHGIYEDTVCLKLNPTQTITHSPFITALPNGDAVNLVALFRPKDDPIVFWSPEGTVIDGPKLDKHNLANASGRELAYVLLRPERIYSDGHENPAPDGIYDVHGWKQFQLESGEPLVIKRASGYGPWADMGTIKEGQDLGNYNLTEVSQLGEQVLAKMFWKFNPEFGIRLVAVDKKGKEYPMEASDEFLGNFEQDQQMLYFHAAMGLNKKELSHFKIQRRPLYWVQFKDFALEPKEISANSELRTENSTSASSPQSSRENAKMIQTQIEILENCKSGEREKWFAAVKALVDIGSPAVPALSDAIRKTNRPRAQSTMALTLRAIGDPQAVPALIDALEKSGFSSDYGVGNPGTERAKFIHKHQMDPSKKSITLGRPVREITVALERLTGHTEGHDHFHSYDENGKRLTGTITITPELRDREKEHRKQVA